MDTTESGASTAPRPFVFVLMPISDKTENVYKFGIKGAASDVGAYAERVDEQNFTEGILERIFNQINKADLIIADMTGKNPNVFYEVGYAHALGKLVLLLTQNVNDIPFDLKHRQHIVYGESIEGLKTALREKLLWAIQQTQRKSTLAPAESLSVLVVNTPVPVWQPSIEIPQVITISPSRASFVDIVIQNQTNSNQPIFGKPSLFASGKTGQTPVEPPKWRRAASFNVGKLDLPHGFDTLYPLQGRTINLASHGAVDAFKLPLTMSDDITESDDVFMLRIQTNVAHHDFVFRLRTRLKAPD